MHEIDPSWQMLYLSHAFQTEILLQDLRFISSANYQCKHSLFINFQSLHSVERFEQIITLSKSLL